MQSLMVDLASLPSPNYPPKRPITLQSVLEGQAPAPNQFTPAIEIAHGLPEP